MSKVVSSLELPWGAWFQDGRHAIELPEHWSVDVFWPNEPAPCSAEEIAQAIASPIGSPPLVELARGCRRACVVVDDLARPTRAADILPALLEQLHKAGLSEDGIRIVVATGTHGTLGETELAWKVGDEIARRYRVECHDSRAPLAGTGIAYGNAELRINRTFLEADLKIAVGSVLPHSFAGYSGGAKLVLPGLCDRETAARSHKFVQLGLRGGADPNENRFRLEAEKLARQLGLKFVVCVVTGVQRETVGVFAGDVVAAHRGACAAARQVFLAKLNAEYDCVLLNAYPKDIDLIQTDSAWVALRTARSPVVREGGVIVLLTAASQGVGRHGLFEPGGLSYRPPAKRRALGSRELWIYAPGLSADQVRKLYWEGYPVFHTPQELAHTLSQRFPQPIKAAVFPCASMQQVEDLRAAPAEACACKP